MVSIVIPAYNVKSQYIIGCINSIINQTYTDFEVIIVDDGSQPSYGIEYENIKKMDSRLCVIHQSNGGVSSARNHGTQVANGEYIMYVDADDFLAPFALQEGIKIINDCDPDMVIAAVKKIKPETIFEPSQHDELIYDIYGDQHDSFDCLREYYFTMRSKTYRNIDKCAYIGRGPWARIIRSNIAKKNLFPDGLAIGEDVVWNLNILQDCRKICVLHSIWYGYVIYDNSAMRKYYGNREEILKKYMQLLLDNNQDYCKRNPVPYAKNMAMEFYMLLKSELLSEKNLLSQKEKNLLVNKYLKNDPWKIMVEPTVFRKLPVKYKILLTACKFNMWQTLMSLRG